MVDTEASALWLRSPGGDLTVAEAPVRAPGALEIVVRARAIAVNPIDAMGGVARRVVLPWLRYPAVIGSDVAGDVVAVGSNVDKFQVGDRVVGYAVGVERSPNNPEHGAFQTFVTLLQHMAAPIPELMTFADACVLPLALTTATAGLFQSDQLALELPVADSPIRGENVVIFGGASSVGMNAIQLARAAGYTVLATASPANTPLLKRLGASVVIDYHASDVVEQLVSHVSGRPLAGTLAIATSSLCQAIAVSASKRVRGTRLVASSQPTPGTRIRAALARRQKITVSAIWGSTPKDNFVGPAIWNDFLPTALAHGDYIPAPTPVVVGHGLEAIPTALARLRAGAHAEKFIVTL